MADTEHLNSLRELLARHRWAALATVGRQQSPEASMVAYVMSERLDEVYLHLSELAAHTRHLQQHPQASLVVSDCDDGQGDPQQLARASLFGSAECVAPDSPAYAAIRARYLARLPDAEPRFSFADFRLFRLRLEKIRFVGGFARASTFTPKQLAPEQSLPPPATP